MSQSRRLAAILAADVAGYSRLMGADEEGTLEDWDNVIIERGDTRRGLPWNLGQFGSNSSFTMARTNYVAAMDAKAKLLEIGARDLGGKAEDYDLADEKIVSKTDKAKSMSFAKAAQRAIELGAAFSGAEVPANLNPITKSAVAMLAGSGLIGVAKDTLPKKGVVPSFAVTFAEIELDAETGEVSVIDTVGVTDCGTVIHPQNLAGQVKGGNTMGIGMARFERHVYDPKLGLPANVGLYQAKPPSLLDVPTDRRPRRWTSPTRGARWEPREWASRQSAPRPRRSFARFPMRSAASTSIAARFRPT
jgi:CO/xanthine dehydrogenase Mo-binding subunit